MSLFVNFGNFNNNVMKGGCTGPHGEIGFPKRRPVTTAPAGIEGGFGGPAGSPGTVTTAINESGIFNRRPPAI